MIDAIRMIKALKRLGFIETGQKGSHVLLEHPVSKAQTSVPMHGGDLKRGLMKAILRQAGLSEDEFREIS